MGFFIEFMKPHLIRRRRLSEQQSRRIAQNTAQKIHDSALCTGVVLANHGKQLLVQALDTVGDMHAQTVYALGTRTGIVPMCAGDRVRFFADEIGGQIEALLPRQSVIFRPDRYHKLKPIAANVDILAITIAPAPTPSALLIDRYLVACRHANIAPMLIINKADILCKQTQNLGKLYERLGIEVLTISCQDGKSAAQLKQALWGKTVILAGQSGVGKSSIANTLGAAQPTGALSVLSKLGQHTTTTSRLLPFDDDLKNGALIDTPGIREYGLWHLTRGDVLAGFNELADLACECRFRDCNHQHGALGCALSEATDDGKIAPSRLANLRTLLDEAKPS